jgi:S-adenosylmethionine hydrolase
MAIITLLTDFGLTDTFVGVMKGVIKSIAPNAEIIDLTHAVPRYDVMQGSILWKSAQGHFPAGTVHLGIVDPGVGTRRQPMAARIGAQFYVCPNNGLISELIGSGRPDEAVALENDRYRLAVVSRTFHGRDIFAPAAAHLSLGIPISALGPVLSDLALPPRPISADASRPAAPECGRTLLESGRPIIGVIRHFDHFGNAWTSIEAAALPPDTREAIVGVYSVPYVQAYGDVDPGAALAIVGSHGRLEIAVNQGNAQTSLALSLGDPVVVRRQE